MVGLSLSESGDPVDLFEKDHECDFVLEVSDDSCQTRSDLSRSSAV